MMKIFSSRFIIAAVILSSIVFSVGLSRPSFAANNEENGNVTASASVTAKVNDNIQYSSETNSTESNNEESYNATVSVNNNETNMENNEGEYTDNYNAYSEEQADSKNEATLTTSHYVYKPGDSVELKGSIFSDLLMKLPQTDRIVAIQIISSSGEDQVIAKSNVTNIADDGKFETTVVLPADVKQGEYEAKATLSLVAVANGTLEESVAPSLSEELETSTSFVVVTNPKSFDVKAEGEDFGVQVATNSTISNVELKQNEKKLSMVVEGQNGTRGVADIVIPKNLLSGDIMVFIDGKETKNFKIVEDNKSTIVVEVSYHHSKHTIDVQGTNVIPEFPVQSLTVIAAIVGSAAIVFGRTTRLFNTDKL
jgi:hypothetical protein